MEERDPLKSQAIESSLWELHALQNHILPSIATAAKFINMPLPSVEWDMSKILENSADDVSKPIKVCDKCLCFTLFHDFRKLTYFVRYVVNSYTIFCVCLY